MHTQQLQWPLQDIWLTIGWVRQCRHLRHGPLVPLHLKFEIRRMEGLPNYHGKIQ